MIKIELLEPIVREEDKNVTILKYIVFDEATNKSLIMRTRLYDNNQTTTYIYDFKKNYINAEVDTYFGCKMTSWKQSLLQLRDNFEKGDCQQGYDGLIDKIGEALHFKVPRWLKSEWLVSRWLDGHMVEEGNAGFDVVDKQGRRYQVKTKEVFKENREYGTRGTIEFKTASSLEFDYLVVVGITELTKQVVEARMWTRDEVLARMGDTKSFSISTYDKFKTGKVLKG